MYAGRIVESAAASLLFAAPAHPYTAGLQRSTPRLDGPLPARLPGIEGNPPNLARLPPGCAFAPRCPHVHERCATAAPPLLESAPGRWSACYLDRLPGIGT
jgi:oligopeptide/dipeptide ABC transporter ATP-binding protein